ncbi:Rha family transcriptional regulator [uncultured Megasphaera sp.]|uniref:Rha family transcriptional regulator n=1 Tax=uncultured Megasphaera sp. TaxID=165188 RepID=UPI00265D30BA|nr:Rha family transcriptional regulator [uncultured Megasphaera sp.]
MNNLQVLSLDSREVSKMIGKEHAKLLRDIDTYNGYLSQNPKLDFDMSSAKLNSEDFWKASSYVSGTGKRYKCYLITKKGCEFIAHKMTGRKGAIFTATYINRFHEMEEELQKQAKQVSGNLRVNIPRNAEMQKKIANVEDSLKAMQRLMVVYNRYNYEESRESIQVAMSLILAYMQADLADLFDAKVDLIEVK